ncbi:bone sialoprotein 2-like [Camellia sinensis]|uniref:bone sialoprotein 2-like n=1 Tax=Camellia sinensis TaxID=4442 RepID=UPI001036661C|nr:bone sialoprotein 2-like [Camellia sinensis]
MLGNDAMLFLEEGEYGTYHHTYLMPPLTGIRTPTRRAAGASLSSRVRATDMPSTSRAGTSRSGPPIEYCDGFLGVVASLESMVLRRETQLFIADVSMPPLQAGPSRPSRRVGRGDSCRRRGRRRAPIVDDEESSKEEETAHPQSETSAGREEDSGSGFEGGDDAEEDSEGDISDSDGDADDGGAEAVQPKRTKWVSESCA